MCLPCKKLGNVWYIYVKIQVFCRPHIVLWSCIKSTNLNHQGSSMRRLLGLCFDTTSFVYVDHSENPLMVYFSSLGVIRPQSDRIWGLQEVFQVFVAWWTSAGPAGWSCIQVQSHASATRTVKLWLLLTSLLSHTSHPSIIALYSCVPANQRSIHAETPQSYLRHDRYIITHIAERAKTLQRRENLKVTGSVAEWCHWLQHTLTPAAWNWEVKGFGHPISHLLLN